jgi:hypothetical protein
VDEVGNPLLKNPLLLARLVVVLLLLLADRMTQQNNSFRRNTKVSRILRLMILSQEATRLDTARDLRDSKEYATQKVSKEFYQADVFYSNIYNP